MHSEFVTSVFQNTADQSQNTQLVALGWLAGICRDPRGVSMARAAGSSKSAQVLRLDLVDR